MRLLPKKSDIISMVFIFPGESLPHKMEINGEEVELWVRKLDKLSEDRTPLSKACERYTNSYSKFLDDKGIDNIIVRSEGHQFILIPTLDSGIVVLDPTFGQIVLNAEDSKNAGDSYNKNGLYLGSYDQYADLLIEALLNSKDPRNRAIYEDFSSSTGRSSEKGKLDTTLVAEHIDLYEEPVLSNSFFESALTEKDEIALNRIAGIHKVVDVRGEFRSEDTKLAIKEMLTANSQIEFDTLHSAYQAGKGRASPW